MYIFLFIWLCSTISNSNIEQSHTFTLPYDTYKIASLLSLKCIIPSQVPDITDICSSPLVMAQQLTHIELERLSFIGPEEFVQAFAKDSTMDATYKDLKKTNNLEVYVQWFNKLSYLVATQAVSVSIVIASISLYFH